MVSAYKVRVPSLKTGYWRVFPAESGRPKAVKRLFLKSIRITPARNSNPVYFTQAPSVSSTVRFLGSICVWPRSDSVPHSTGPASLAPVFWAQPAEEIAHNPSKSVIFVENRMNRQKYQK